MKCLNKKISLIKGKTVKIGNDPISITISRNNNMFTVTLYVEGTYFTALSTRLITAYNTCVGDYYNYHLRDTTTREDYLICDLGCILEIMESRND